MLVLLRYGPSRPTQMLCDLIELEPEDPVLVPLELEVLASGSSAQEILERTVVADLEILDHPVFQAAVDQ